jgi:hypothetical protein
MAPMHDSEPTVALTFGIFRLQLGKFTGIRETRRRNTSRRETFTDRIHKGISHIQIRIESFM